MCQPYALLYQNLLWVAGFLSLDSVRAPIIIHHNYAVLCADVKHLWLVWDSGNSAEIIIYHVPLPDE